MLELLIGTQFFFFAITGQICLPVLIAPVKTVDSEVSRDTTSHTSVSNPDEIKQTLSV